MPMREMLKNAGVLDPKEIDLLTRVYEVTCRQFENNSDREQRARRIIEIYQSGIRDEAELTELARQDLGR